MENPPQTANPRRMRKKQINVIGDSANGPSTHLHRNSRSKSHYIRGHSPIDLPFLLTPIGNTIEETPDEPLTEAESNAIKILKNFWLPIIQKSRVSKDQKRRNIIHELIQTEKNYVSDLTILKDIYYKPLDLSITTRKPLIDSKSLMELFGNFDEILRVHQDEILSELNSKILPALQDVNFDNKIYSKIAHCFLNLIPRLQQLYTTYFSTHKNSNELIHKLKKNKSFRDFLAKQLFNPTSKCQEIEDLLILPTQRMGGYKLLFERLLKYCKIANFEGPLSSIQSVFNAIKFLGSTINSNAPDSSNQEQLLNIAETVSHLPPFLVILQPGRKSLGTFKAFKYDPQTGERKDRVMGYILNDMILLVDIMTTRFGIVKQVYLDAIPYSQIKIQPCDHASIADRGFVLKTDTQEYYLMMLKEKARIDLENFIKTTKKQIRINVRRQSMVGKNHMKMIMNQLSSMYLNPPNMRSREESLEFLSK